MAKLDFNTLSGVYQSARTILSILGNGANLADKTKKMLEVPTMRAQMCEALDDLTGHIHVLGHVGLLDVTQAPSPKQDKIRGLKIVARKPSTIYADCEVILVDRGEPNEKSIIQDARWVTGIVNERYISYGEWTWGHYYHAFTEALQDFNERD